MAKNERRSRQRDLIYEYLKDTVSHPTADEVYINVKEKIPNISLGTVYRNLASLTEDKKIIRVMNVNGSEHYDGNTENHYHFLCKNCGRIYDLDMKVLPLEDVVKETTNFLATSHEINFTGFCEECLNKNNL